MDASLEWCSTPPLWHTKAVGGRPPCTLGRRLVATGCKLARRARSAGATRVHPCLEHHDGHVPRRVGRDAGPVGSRALERQYRDRPASWRLVSSRRARIMADGTVSWFVGVDWGSEKHQVCLLDAAGQVVGERAFRHGGAGLAALCDWLVSVAGDPGLVAVAIEVPHGPVVDALLDRGFAVHAINPKQLERLRDRISLAGAKDDRRDARVAAGGLRTDPHLFRPVEAGDPAVIALREWSRLAEELQQERIRLSNRIRQQLWRYYPQLLAVS